MVTHTLMMCLTLAAAHFFDAVKHNYDDYQRFNVLSAEDEEKKKREDEFNTMAGAAAELKKPSRKTIISHLAKFDYNGFVSKYLPILALWFCRISSVIIAYAYYGYAGFLILSWVLLSFICPMVGFVKWSTRLYLPVFMLAFFYEYTINIQCLVQLPKKESISFYKYRDTQCTP